ncbi:IS66 family transposase [Hydrogenophaga sp.]|uniref:IS66 family transposase n=1 Tax=Hydrogenophaga sp. TaxID=1904254 RepID=UPI00343D5D83
MKPTGRSTPAAVWSASARTQSAPDRASTRSATGARWRALTHYLEDRAVAIDNNHLERQIKP